MTIDNDLKEAICQMPQKEKDKLLLRLIRKDKILTQKLFFELLENKSMEDKREELEEKILLELDQLSKGYFTSHQLLTWLKSISRQITIHLKVTKDQLGEISLHLLTLNCTLERCHERLYHMDDIKTQKLYDYMAAKTLRMIKLIQQSHEEVRFDYKGAIEQWGRQVSNNPSLKDRLIKKGLKISWLVDFNLPEVVSPKKNIPRQETFY
jgi:hypothetical protein